MLPLFVFIVGLVLLFKGSFRFGVRFVPKPRGRVIGLVLMAPLLVGFCHGLLIGVMELGNIDPEAMLAPGAQTALMERIINTYTDQLFLVQMVSLLVAIGIALYLVLTSPIGAPVPQPAFPYPGVPGPVSQVMTPGEAAAYLRVSESDVRTLIDQGRLAAARIGGDYRIARRAIEDFLSESAEQNRTDDPFAGI